MTAEGSERAETSRLSNEELRRRLAAELSDLEEQLRTRAPGYEPPPFSIRRLAALVEEVLARFPKDFHSGALGRLCRATPGNLLDLQAWRSVWYVLNYWLRYSADLVRHRYTGEYDTDEWGLDWEVVAALLPIFRFLYKTYWRVETEGLLHIPAQGRALLVANHSGMLPWDGAMVGTAILTEHPAQRLVRGLYAALLGQMPHVSILMVRLGQALATVENGTRLLEQDELVVVFPEGYKGIGKPYKDRYKLARFGRGGFVETALNTQAPIIPVSVVGAEETSVTLAKVPIWPGASGVPYLPITLTFPWLGLLGFLPLPTKWYIDFGEPIPTDGYELGAGQNPILVSQLSDLVRNRIQDMICSRLAQRRSIFFG
jgi:1-acyl-sn-glycerol-3-phosphate acyltransferase